MASRYPNSENDPFSSNQVSKNWVKPFDWQLLFATFRSAFLGLILPVVALAQNLPDPDKVAPE
jgi:hypothetical protein